MSPSDFKQAREKASNDKSVFLISNRPYFPNLKADSSNEISLKRAAAYIVYYPNAPPTDNSPSILQQLSCSKVSGGITNELYKISGFSSSAVLLRIFGAEGMIDRDIETTTYAALCDAGIAFEYHGRFANGRVEGWLDGFQALSFHQLGNYAIGIAVETARLHATFEMNETLDKEVTLWKQLFDWYHQASHKISNLEFLNKKDCKKAEELIKDCNVLSELMYLKEHVVPSNVRTCFCHNDLLAANVMVHPEKENKIQLIDFEYGGYNYLSADIANHFNEYAGGTDDGVPDYSYFPTNEKQLEFLEAYVTSYNKLSPNDKLQVLELKEEVDAFILVNNFYWGLWAINQATVEGCEGFDYMLYAENRFKRYKDTCPAKVE